MFCGNCGHNLADKEGAFCPNCGKQTASAPQGAQPVSGAVFPRAVKMMFCVLALAALGAGGFFVVQALVIPNMTDESVSFLIEEAPDRIALRTMLWDFDWEYFTHNEVLLSVSPSGNYILAADFGSIDLSMRLLYGANALGHQVQHISLYERQGHSFRLVARIELDPERNPEFNDTVASSDATGVAWNEDETLLLITGGTIRTRGHWQHGASNIYLVDFSGQSVERLTNNTRGRFIFITLPQWSETHGVTFIRTEWTDDGLYTNLMRMDIETGRQEMLADLTNNQRATYVYEYVIHGDYVYYIDSIFGGLEATGFFRANLDGGQSYPYQLLSMMDFVDFYSVRLSNFISVQISQDGRWALLTARDQRFFARDIPLADHPYDPQPDPSSAISYMTRREWIPFHNVILYDLERSELVNPFTDRSLRPDVVIITAATFAPDGKSFLAAAFGSGGLWVMDSFHETTLYQVRLDDGSFDAMRIARIDSFTPDRLLWLENNTLLVEELGGGRPPMFPVQLVKPSAFEQFGD